MSAEGLFYCFRLLNLTGNQVSLIIEWFDHFLDYILMKQRSIIITRYLFSKSRIGKSIQITVPE